MSSASTQPIRTVPNGSFAELQGNVDGEVVLVHGGGLYAVREGDAGWGLVDVGDEVAFNAPAKLLSDEVFVTRMSDCEASGLAPLYDSLARHFGKHLCGH